MPFSAGIRKSNIIDSKKVLELIIVTELFKMPTRHAECALGFRAKSVKFRCADFSNPITALKVAADR